MIITDGQFDIFTFHFSSFFGIFVEFKIISTQ